MLEIEAHTPRALRRHFLHVGVVGAVLRGSLAHQRFEGEHHVLGLYRLAVMKACLWTQVKAYPVVVRALFYLFREQAVDAERLVQAVGGEGVVDQADIVSRNALVDERVERIEAAETSLSQRPTLGSVGVGIFEMLEIGRVLRLLVIQRQGMARSGFGDSSEAEQPQQPGAEQRMARAIIHLVFSRLFSHQARKPSV